MNTNEHWQVIEFILIYSAYVKIKRKITNCQILFYSEKNESMIDDEEVDDDDAAEPRDESIG
jgi:hypothetical protein